MSKAKKRPAVSLVIPVRGKESLLQRTIDGANQTAFGEVEIIVVDNGYEGPAPFGKNLKIINCADSGTGHARHAGVMVASAPVVITIDAHVKLCPMWDEYVLTHFETPSWNKTIACGYVGGLNINWSERESPCYTGAKMHWVEIKEGEIRPMAAKWHDNRHGEKIGAVMGAFYAFKKSWYKTIGQPWGVFDSWGCDEELISMASWMSGGDCRLMHDHVQSWHLFDRPERVAYTPGEIMDINANRFKLLLLFPFPEDDVAEIFRRWPQISGIELKDRQKIFARKHESSGKRLKAYLKNHVEGYASWRAELASAANLPPNPAPAASAPPAPPVVRIMRPAPPQRLQTRPRDICDRCDAVDSYVCYRTERNFRRYKCKACGRKAWRPNDGGPMQFTVNND